MPNEITRDSLHRTLKEKPKEVQDKFLEVANFNIRKGCTISQSVSLANKAVEDLEIDLEKVKKSKEENQVQINKAKVVESFKNMKPLQVQKMFEVEQPADIDPEQIKSIYFDNNGKLIIEFEDGFKITSKNSFPPSYIEQHVTVAVNPVFDYIQFNIEAFNPVKPPHIEGLVFYDFEDHSLAYYNDESDVTVNLGREQLLRVYNSTDSAFVDGQLVYLSGAFQGVPTVTLAKADSHATSEPTIGMVTSNIAPSSFGYVCTSGLVHDINTASYPVGTVLYLSADTAGAYTNVEPLQPYHVVEIGSVCSQGATTGDVFVKVVHKDWFPSIQLMDTRASIVLPTTPTVFIAPEVTYNDGFTYNPSTGVLEWLNNGSYTVTIQFNASPSASNKSIYFYVEQDAGAGFVPLRYTARQIKLINGVEDQVQITATRYFSKGTKLRYLVWGDSTVTLKSTDLSGTTPGTVTLPAFRFNIA